MATQVVVLGMHRSGTSMVASMLAALGVFMGERLIGADPSNATGHWEDWEFSRLNRAVLRAAGGSWDLPPPPTAILTTGRLFRKMQKLVDARNRAHALWGFKDPRTTLTYDLWAQFLADPRVVIVSRNEAAVVDSLYRRNGIPAAWGSRLVGQYMDALAASQELSKAKVLRIDYEQVLDEPLDVAKTLRRHVGSSGGPMALADAAFRVRPDLNHHAGVLA